MTRTILHVDCNKFYASVECLHRPEIRNKPVAVGGKESNRHGIILTKNEIASKYDISVGETIWSAKRKCPDLIIISPNFPLYVRFSNLVRNILKSYTNIIEPFGLDECWLDITDCVTPERNGEQIAYEIKEKIKFELGITVSIGVSFNKIFAKLGSDYKKPNAITIISKENFKNIVWNLPANDLLFIGPATYRKLVSHYRYTIGDVANTDIKKLVKWFGKTGYILHSFANGYDNDPVIPLENSSVIKSIGNSVTSPRDLINNEDVKSVFYVLGESVCRRMREQGFKCSLIRINIRNTELITVTRQKKIKIPTNITNDVIEKAVEIFKENYNWAYPVRSIGISVTDFTSDTDDIQYDFFTDITKIKKLESIDSTVDVLKKRYGNFCIQRASLLKDSTLTGFNPYNDHTIHPVSVFKAK